MKTADLLKARRPKWQELEVLCARMEGAWRHRLPAGTVAHFAALYRAACADLALADAYQLPPAIIQYLHQLVGRAHNQLYRSRSFRVSVWMRELLVNVPRRLYSDNCLRLAMVIFWGTFLMSSALAYKTPDFAERVVGSEMIEQMETMYAEPHTGRDADQSAFMSGFYIHHNTGIGLRCFAFGLFLGVGGLWETVFNAAVLGTVFGHMATSPESDNFFTFVTAHGPFELTAIVLMAAAGMRLGFSIVNTRGRSRRDSLRHAARQIVPVVSMAVLLFAGAAGIEAFVSPSAAPYFVKAGVAILTASMLVFYIVFLGYPGEKMEEGFGS